MKELEDLKIKIIASLEKEGYTTSKTLADRLGVDVSLINKVCYELVKE